MKHSFTTTFLILLVMLFSGFSVKAQENTDQERETINRFFWIENLNSGSINEQALWVLVRENSGLLSGVSLNQASGGIKLGMYPGTDIRKVMQIFYEHQYILTFKDEDGVKKGYDPKTGQIITVQ